ncbi:hypothetical protein D9C73_021777 [Collichthys lucidus]|uniref:Uncharacterized protein n=1 Tax=Collichthys lucidus TaxID=240159 RepID=A0A4U5VH84_COLLU|nr:hypothetical protein D9C73_021777 [Collichthys lucidus]
MVAPGEETRSSTVVLPSPALRLLSGGNGTSDRSLFRQDVKQATGKVKKRKQDVLTHGLHRVQHFSCDSPGLTATKIPDRLVGWGPGPVFTLLDSELRPVDVALDGLDIRACQAAEHSSEVVTAGEGNVCVWSVMLMRCKVKIQDGLQHSTFTHIALAPPRCDRPHRAFAACGWVLTVVDLDVGTVLEHKRDLCSGCVWERVM